MAERYDEAKTAALIANMPMNKWSSSSKGTIAFADGVFRLPAFQRDPPLLYEWTREICLYRLQAYFERRG